MALASLQAAEIRGLTPQIDPVNSDRTFVLSGKNYTFDSLGPKSAFGHRIVSTNPFLSDNMRRGAQFLKTSNRTLLLTNEAIFEIHPVTNELIPQLLFEPFTQIARWTNAFINGVDYFCHPGIGILYWDQRSGSRGLLDVSGVPSSPLAIVADNGRLAVLDLRTLTWSAPSNGFNFTPSNGGAGAQVIGDRISGTPVAVTSYSRGILTWTTEGVMRSEFAGGIEVYRHRGINTEYRPINSFCFAKLDDDTTVILDPRGLFSSRGEPPVPFQPDFNEFLIEELKKADYLRENNLRLSWDNSTRRLYISRTESIVGTLYDQALALYVPLGRWGSFDEKHYGLGRGFFLDESGYLRQFSGMAHRDAFDSSVTTAYMFDPLRQYPLLAQRQRESHVLSSTFRLSALPESQSLNLRIPGHYTYDASVRLTFTLSELNAELVLGLFRLPNPEYSDQMIELNAIRVGSVISRELSTDDVDYNLVPDGVNDIDYNVAIGTEDFGLNPVSFINFHLRSIGSVDGQTSFLTRTPVLARYHDAQRVYAGGAVGIWHMLEFSTVNPGDYFHIRSLHIDGANAGRYL